MSETELIFLTDEAGNDLSAQNHWACPGQRLRVIDEKVATWVCTDPELYGHVRRPPRTMTGRSSG